jgi:hypothetical protein
MTGLNILIALKSVPLGSLLGRPAMENLFLRGAFCIAIVFVTEVVDRGKVAQIFTLI